MFELGSPPPGEGIVYVFTNEAMPGMKIGRTSGDTVERRGEVEPGHNDTSLKAVETGAAKQVALALLATFCRNITSHLGGRVKYAFGPQNFILLEHARHQIDGGWVAARKLPVIDTVSGTPS